MNVIKNYGFLYLIVVGVLLSAACGAKAAQEGKIKEMPETLNEISITAYLKDNIPGNIPVDEHGKPMNRVTKDIQLIIHCGYALIIKEVIIEGAAYSANLTELGKGDLPYLLGRDYKNQRVYENARQGMKTFLVSLYDPRPLSAKKGNAPDAVIAIMDGKDLQIPIGKKVNLLPDLHY